MLSKNQNRNKRVEPVIIVGMHRSGTSIVTRMLKELGLFIGWDCGINDEATFFNRRNEKILSVCGGGWDNPNVIDKLLGRPELRKKVVDLLSEDISSFHAFLYLGPKFYLRYRAITKLNMPWGWKDPRNIITLPLWLEIFPSARIIHIYRNGIDVANSLARRDEVSITRVLKNESYVDRQVKLFKKKGLLRYNLTKLYYSSDKLDPLRKFNMLRLYSFMTLEAGFDLWCSYMQRISNFLDSLQNKVINIKYEDFILDPQKHLQRLAGFCSLPIDEHQIKAVAAYIKPDRSYAYRNDSELLNVYESLEDNYWMRKLGYNG